jgi:choline dehydrogenase-like flavoprotein
MDYFVIGSGPAGVACALGLLEQGAQVTLLDVGDRLEPALRAQAESLSLRAPHEWRSEEIRAIAEPPQMEGGKLAKKTLFGSSFAYAEGAEKRFVQQGSHALQSYAKGGLSNVWGASVLPFLPEEMVHWPIATRHLSRHYDALSPLLPVAAEQDALQAWFPLPQTTVPPMVPSLQAERWSEELLTRRKGLEKRGLYLGRSRLAVQTQEGHARNACRNAGICLTGCPYFAIFESGSAIDTLLRNPRFKYLPHWRVTRLSETPSGAVEIEALKAGDVNNGERFQAAKVFLAAGPLSTLEIVFRSTAVRPLKTQLRYNPYFILPLLTFRATYSETDPKAHSLSQLFLELKRAEISPYWVHLQVYTHSPVLAAELLKRLRFLGPLRVPVANWVLRRLIFVQGYLHSESAPPIEVESIGDRIRLTAKQDPTVRSKVHRIVFTLVRLAFSLRALPLFPLLHQGNAGEGNHLGGAFPMSETPAPFSTDAIGRLSEFRNIHLVDSSVLPSLPATTLTYSVMANAHRIAVESFHEQKEPAVCE